jgi:hypothetical protein
MAILFACPGCKSTWKVADEFAGRITRCQSCGTGLRIPAPAVKQVADVNAAATPPSSVQAPEPNRSVPFFTALAAFGCKTNRLYRIYIRADELVFIWAGSGYELAMAGHAGGAAGVQGGAVGGLIGGLVGALIAKWLDSTKKNAARKAVLDSTPLDDLIGDNPKNLRVALEDIEEVRIGPRSQLHAGLYSDKDHQALLHLRHKSLGKYRLGIAAVEDIQVAIRELPRVLGERCRVGIEWSEQKDKFVKRRDAKR